MNREYEVAINEFPPLGFEKIFTSSNNDSFMISAKLPNLSVIYNYYNDGTSDFSIIPFRQDYKALLKDFELESICNIGTFDVNWLSERLLYAKKINKEVNEHIETCDSRRNRSELKTNINIITVTLLLFIIIFNFI
ncbi:hypothetical protein L4D09_22160 [Photobacterium makurazakiensis]|uniref:hypothetical protein n=1 Tax=Photobacterium makurazakiensis TaxID=2910234 RepID=UPI003D152EE2